MRCISVLSLAALLGVTLAQQKSSSRDMSISCLVYQDLSFFDMRPIQSKTDYEVQSADKNQTYFFNLCGQTNKKCSNSVSDVLAYKIDSASGECTELTDLSVKKPLVVESETGTFVMFSFGSPKSKCTNAQGEEVDYKLSVNLRCDKNDSNSGNDFSDLSINTDDICRPVITGNNPNACPVFSVTAFAKFFIKKPQILGILTILFGLVVALYGRKFFEVTIFATGSIAGFGITMLLFLMLSMLTSFSQKGGDLSIIGTILSFVFSVCMGVFLGFILRKMVKIGAAIMGAIGGVFLAFTVHNILFFWLDNKRASQIILWMMSLVAAVGMAYLSKKQFENIVIFGTALLGAYCVIRGISFLIPGTFPAESTIVDQISSGDIDPSFYGYLAGFIVLSIGGILHQKKQFFKEALSRYIRLN